MSYNLFSEKISVPTKELQPLIDKSNLLVKELENQLKSFMVEPEKNVVIKWFPDSPLGTAGLKLIISL